MRKPPKNFVCAVEWLCVVHGEEIYEKVPRYVRHPSLNRAHDEKQKNPSKD